MQKQKYAATSTTLSRLALQRDDSATGLDSATVGMIAVLIADSVHAQIMAMANWE